LFTHNSPPLPSFLKTNVLEFVQFLSGLPGPSLQLNSVTAASSQGGFDVVIFARKRSIPSLRHVLDFSDARPRATREIEPFGGCHRGAIKELKKFFGPGPAKAIRES
jgi:hypothetical protein